MCQTKPQQFPHRYPQRSFHPYTVHTCMFIGVSCPVFPSKSRVDVINTHWHFGPIVRKTALNFYIQLVCIWVLKKTQSKNTHLHTDWICDLLSNISLPTKLPESWDYDWISLTQLPQSHFA